MKEIIHIKGAPTPIGPYSQAIVCNNMMFISGQIPLNPTSGEMITDDIRLLARQVMDNIGALLKQAGLNFNNVVKTTIILADINDFADVNEVYSSYFNNEFPARETFQAAHLPKDARIEISAIAMLK